MIWENQSNVAVAEVSGFNKNVLLCQYLEESKYMCFLASANIMLGMEPDLTSMVVETSSRKLKAVLNLAR